MRFEAVGWVGHSFNPTYEPHDTFGQVTWFDGSQLERDKLLVTMLDKAKKPAA